MESFTTRFAREKNIPKTPQMSRATNQLTTRAKPNKTSEIPSARHQFTTYPQKVKYPQMAQTAGDRAQMTRCMGANGRLMREESSEAFFLSFPSIPPFVILSPLQLVEGESSWLCNRWLLACAAGRCK